MNKVIKYIIISNKYVMISSLLISLERKIKRAGWLESAELWKIRGGSFKIRCASGKDVQETGNSGSF